MDLVTQVVLGAAVGEATLGHKIGNKAALWGASFGLVPDLDILAEPFVTELQRFMVHRSFTHSLLFMVTFTPLFGWLLTHWYTYTPVTWKRWNGMIFLVLSTHVLLDCLNNYGTQVFYPFSNYPVNLNIFFVIDPLFSVPILAGIFSALFFHRRDNKRRTLNYGGLLISSLYLLWAVGAKYLTAQEFRQSLNKQEIAYSRFMNTPTPFNTFLWSGYAEHKDTLFIGLYSVFDDDQRIHFHKIAKNTSLLQPYKEEKAVQYPLWFSRGYFTVTRQADTLYFHDLRFGRQDLWMDTDGAYVWSYKLVSQLNPPRITEFKRMDPGFPDSKNFWLRYWNRITGQK